MRVSRRERGEGQFGCIVGLIILAVGIFIAWKMIPIKVRAADLRQEVMDDAKSAGMMNDEKIMKSILNKARENDLPVTENNVKISRGSNQINIVVDYVVPVEFPGYTYQWHIHNEQSNPIF